MYGNSAFPLIFALFFFRWRVVKSCGGLRFQPFTLKHSNQPHHSPYLSIYLKLKNECEGCAGLETKRYRKLKINTLLCVFNLKKYTLQPSTTLHTFPQLSDWRSGGAGNLFLALCLRVKGWDSCFYYFRTLFFFAQNSFRLSPKSFQWLGFWAPWAYAHIFISKSESICPPYGKIA